MSDAAAYLAMHCHGDVRTNEPLAPFTSYQLGGPASVYVEPESEDDLRAIADTLNRYPMEVLVVGRGSNMLVSDRGFAGMAIRLGSGFRKAEIHGDRLHAKAAMPVPALAGLAAKSGLAGFEFAVAIPASLGGAIAMNAGAHGHSVSEVVSTVEVFALSSGEARTMIPGDLAFAYRSSRLPPLSIVTGAVLQLAAGNPEEIDRKLQEARSWRRATQPIGLPNAGSVFKNPPEEAAGSLVERIVGKGASVGGARVSEVHANFIVTEPGATARDVYSLIRTIQSAVLENAGVRLETEVKLVGEFS